MPISKRLRFEVFKRDSFTCQYCGSQAPAVVLHADHIQPQSKEGEDDLTNLVTACSTCNSGKSNILLSDDSAIAKRKKQLDELQERREQLELMFEWHKELLEIEAEAVDRVADLFIELSGAAISVTEAGRSALQRCIKRFGLNEVILSIQESLRTYGKESEGGGATADSARVAFQKIGPVCAVRRQEISEPYLKAVYYIRGILRKRVSNTPGYDEGQCIAALRRVAASKVVPLEAVQDLACRSNSWRGFYKDLRFMEEDYGQQSRR